MGSKYITLYGQNFIFDEVCGIKYKLDVASFFQVNRAQAEILYNTAIDFAKIQKDDVVADIYCGVCALFGELYCSCFCSLRRCRGGDTGGTDEDKACGAAEQKQPRGDSPCDRAFEAVPHEQQKYFQSSRMYGLFRR